MKKPWFGTMVGAGVLGVWIGAVSGSEAQEASRTIEARTVPAPAAASEELRKAIMAAPPLDLFQGSTPQSDAEWEQFVNEGDEALAEALPMLAEQLGVTVSHFQVLDVSLFRVVPSEVDPEHIDRLFVYVHGGGYVLGGGEAGLQEAVLIASRARIPVLAIDYRMPPQHPFPAAVEDVVKIYRHILGSWSANAIALGGTSAGGGLALAVVHRLMELGVEVPGVIYAGTPWADLTKTSDTLFTNEAVDRVLVTYDGVLCAMALLYANGRDLKDPLISPLYGEFQGFPPTYLVTGTRDMLLSDTVRAHRRLRAAGVIADLNVYEGLSHADYLLVPDSPESQQVYAELNEFLRHHLE